MSRAERIIEIHSLPPWTETFLVEETQEEWPCEVFKGLDDIKYDKRVGDKEAKRFVIRDIQWLKYMHLQRSRLGFDMLNIRQ